MRTAVKRWCIMWSLFIRVFCSVCETKPMNVQKSFVRISARMLNVTAQDSGQCQCVPQTPVGRDTADLMVRSSGVFYMQSLLSACVFFWVGGYMIHKSWLIPLCGFSSQDFSRHVNSSTEPHQRAHCSAKSWRKQASRRCSASKSIRDKSLGFFACTA